MKWLTRCHDLRFLNVELKANFFMKLVTSHIQYSPLPFWRRKWQPTPVLLPGKSHGQRSLVYCNPWGREESDTTERLHFHFSLSCIREGNGNPLQYSCLENPRDRGAWLAAVYGVSQSQTRLKRLSSSSSSSSHSLSFSYRTVNTTLLSQGRQFRRVFSFIK